MRVNRNLRSFWRRFIGQLGTLLLSIVMGLIVWLIAINQENPIVTDYYPEPIPLHISGLAPNLTLLEPVNNVRVQLQGPQKAWANLSASVITATLDLSNLGTGPRSAPLRITVDAPEITPKPGQTMSVYLDTEIAKTLPVQVEIMDSPAYGYNDLTPIVEPPTVDVFGPSTRMRRVSAARAQIYLRGAQDQVARELLVDAVDSNKQIVEQVVITPTNISVTVPIAAWPGRKQVGVRVDLQGQPADGYRLGPVKVNPTNVVLIGSSDDLNSIGVVESEPVSVEGAVADIRARLKLLLPPRVSAFEGDTVDVIIGIVPVEDSIRITLRPTIRELGPGLVATVGLDTVDVIMSGLKSVLDGLASDDVFVILNLKNRLAGTHVLTPQVVIPDGIRLEGVLPETVEVVITNVASTTITATLPSSSTLVMTGTLTTTPTASLTSTLTATLTSTLTATLPISGTAQVTPPPTSTPTPPATVSSTPVDAPTETVTSTRAIPRPTPATASPPTPSPPTSSAPTATVQRPSP